MSDKQNSIQEIETWFKKAKPNPTSQNVIQQTSYCLEEIKELFDAINLSYAASFVGELKECLLEVSRQGEEACELMIKSWDKKELLDAACDVTVTLVGVSTYLGQNFPGALQEVSDSNNSKFDSLGNPILDQDGKILKGHHYFKPNLDPFL